MLVLFGNCVVKSQVLKNKVTKTNNQTTDGHVGTNWKDCQQTPMERVTTLTSDNAEVMKSTCRKLGFTWFGCIPHIINLVVKNGLNILDCANLLASIGAIASYFRSKTFKGESNCFTECWTKNKWINHSVSNIFFFYFHKNLAQV